MELPYIQQMIVVKVSNIHLAKGEYKVFPEIKKEGIPHQPVKKEFIVISEE